MIFKANSGFHHRNQALESLWPHGLCAVLAMCRAPRGPWGSYSDCDSLLLKLTIYSGFSLSTAMLNYQRVEGVTTHFLRHPNQSKSHHLFSCDRGIRHASWPRNITLIKYLRYLQPSQNHAEVILKLTQFFPVKLSFNWNLNYPPIGLI